MYYVLHLLLVCTSFFASFVAKINGVSMYFIFCFICTYCILMGGYENMFDVAKINGVSQAVQGVHVANDERRDLNTTLLDDLHQIGEVAQGLYRIAYERLQRDPETEIGDSLFRDNVRKMKYSLTEMTRHLSEK
jgi:hypothetical protein